MVCIVLVGSFNNEVLLNLEDQCEKENGDLQIIFAITSRYGTLLIVNLRIL